MFIITTMIFFLLHLFVNETSFARLQPDNDIKREVLDDSYIFLTKHELIDSISKSIDYPDALFKVAHQGSVSISIGFDNHGKFKSIEIIQGTSVGLTSAVLNGVIPILSRLIVTDYNVNQGRLELKFVFQISDGVPVEIDRTIIIIRREGIRNYKHIIRN